MLWFLSGLLVQMMEVYEYGFVIYINVYFFMKYMLDETDLEHVCKWFSRVHYGTISGNFYKGGFHLVDEKQL